MEGRYERMKDLKEGGRKKEGIERRKTTRTGVEGLECRKKRCKEKGRTERKEDRKDWKEERKRARSKAKRE